jgi:hypothetical protein
MEFYVYGPFEMKRNPDSRLIAHDNDSKKIFWESVDEVEEGLSDSCGCYLFAMSASGSKKPWYVGKAEKQSFRSECFQPHKINHYNDIVGKFKGKPLLFLISKVTGNGSFVKPSKNSNGPISALENMMIGMSIAKNKDLLNLKGTKMMRELIVHGVINANQGNPGVASSELRIILGI